MFSNKLRYIIFSFMLLLNFGCKEEPFELVENEPVFYINAVVAGTAFELVAGDNDYYMFAATTALEEGQILATGTFASEVENECSPYLKFIFNDNFDRFNGNEDSNMYLSTSNYTYEIPDPNNPGNNFRILNLIASDSSAINTWTVDGDNVDSNTGYTTSVIYENSGIGFPEIKVCLEEVANGGNCISTNCKIISLEDAEINCDIDFFIEGNTLTVTNFNPQFNYQLNDTLLPFVEGFYIIDTVEVFLEDFGPTLCLQYFCENNIVENCKPIQMNEDNFIEIVCSTNFEYNIIDSIVAIQEFQYDRVVIEYMDDSCNIFRSNLSGQEEAAFFNVLNSEMYEQNELGIETQKLNIDFNCQLFGEDNNSLDLSGKGVIAVGLP